MSKQTSRSMKAMQVSAACGAETASSCSFASGEMNSNSALALVMDTIFVVSIFVILLAVLGALSILHTLVILGGLILLVVVEVLLENNISRALPNEQPYPTQ